MPAQCSLATEPPQSSVSRNKTSAYACSGLSFCKELTASRSFVSFGFCPLSVPPPLQLNEIMQEVSTVSVSLGGGGHAAGGVATLICGPGSLTSETATLAREVREFFFLLFLESLGVQLAHLVEQACGCSHCFLVAINIY
jgi:hypothetical protein